MDDSTQSEIIPNILSKCFSHQLLVKTYFNIIQYRVSMSRVSMSRVSMNRVSMNRVPSIKVAMPVTITC